MLPLFCGFLYNPQITIKCQTYISLLVNSHISTYEQLKMNIASFRIDPFLRWALEMAIFCYLSKKQILFNAWLSVNYLIFLLFSVIRLGLYSIPFTVLNINILSILTLFLGGRFGYWLFLCVSVCFWQMSVSIILDSKVRIRFELCKCLIITISMICPKTNCSDLLRCPQIYFC